MADIGHHAFTTFFNGLSNRLYNEAQVVYKDNTFNTSLALWDTGATGTCVSENVVNTLNLKPVSYTKIQTPSGEDVRPLYLVDVVLRNNVRITDLKVIGTEIGKQGIDLLIGMDIIGMGDFAVSNSEGKTVFTYRIPSQATTDYVTALQSRIPTVKTKKPGRNDPCPCGSGKKYKNCCGRNA